MNQFKDFNINVTSKAFTGDKIKMNKILNKEIEVIDYKIVDSKYAEKGNGKRLDMQIKIKDDMHVVFTGSISLMEQIELVPDNGFPFSTTIVQENERYRFT